MDVVALLHRAREAGLRVEFTGDGLVVRGPKRAEPVVRLLAAHKTEVMAVLAATAQENNLLAPTPLFERVAQPAEGEPGLEQPCIARRGRVQQLDGVFLHFCVKCGRFGAYGCGVRLRAGQLGRWYCAAHRPGSDGR